MKIVRSLDNGWSLIKLNKPAEKLSSVELAEISEGSYRGEWTDVRSMPAQVHDILLQNNLVSKEIEVGWCESVKWVGENDWIYKCSFDTGSEARRVYLNCKGLDTVVDIYLNGTLIACHDDFYLPEKVEVTGQIKEKNTLIFHFHNTYDYLKKLKLNEEWEGRVQKIRLMRKPTHDFPWDITEGSSYQGANKFHTPIGIYNDVNIEITDRSEITDNWLRTSLNEDYSSGEVRIDVSGEGRLDNGHIAISMLDPEGNRIVSMDCAIYAHLDNIWKAYSEFTVANPRLWYPRGFGGQPLYTLQIRLYDGDYLCDELIRKVGFKDVQTDGNLGFIINGKTVRLWGGSMDPFYGLTHCYPADRVKRLLDMVENANMNTLRCWGEGIPYDDKFYDEADRRGILIWQEFFLGFNVYPDTLEYRNKLKLEAEFLIKRLRHRACLLMWCGGNETRMGSEFEAMGKKFIGEEVQNKDFPEICAVLDPGRYYHESSPSCGRWANDPTVGDYHTYDCIWYYPDGEYPNFVSEHIRTAPPVLHSLKKFIRSENFWPEGYTGKFTYRDRFPLPDSWMERVCIGASMHIKTGPIWEYYDADTPEEMIYRFGAAYGQEMRDLLERVRMGSPDGGLYRKQRSRGHFSCKLNDTWPKIYCAVIDFFQEGYIPYYATKRGQEPVLVCFDIRDHINLWLVNDSREDIEGKVVFKLFNLKENRFVKEVSVDAKMPQGQSDIILNLDFLKQFKKQEHLLYACYMDNSGRVINYSIDYVDIERHLRFPDAQLNVRVEGNTLVITTDSFARCVEIGGNEDGDEFTWLFEDNYFDLLPGDEKRVRILGKHRKGTVTLKPHYSKNCVVIDYNNS